MYKPDDALQYAINKASNIEVERVSSRKIRQRIYAVCLDKKGRIVSESSNDYEKSHPYQYQCACKVGRNDAIYLHAEISALLKARKPVYKIVVARVGATNRPLLAAPCNICQTAIKDYGVKAIEYTL